jgi:hypothetical protein
VRDYLRRIRSAFAKTLDIAGGGGCDELPLGNGEATDRSIRFLLPELPSAPRVQKRNGPLASGYYSLARNHERVNPTGIRIPFGQRRGIVILWASLLFLCRFIRLVSFTQLVGVDTYDGFTGQYQITFHSGSNDSPAGERYLRISCPIVVQDNPFCIPPQLVFCALYVRIFVIMLTFEHDPVVGCHDPGHARIMRLVAKPDFMKQELSGFGVKNRRCRSSSHDL